MREWFGGLDRGLRYCWGRLNEGSWGIPERLTSRLSDLWKDLHRGYVSWIETQAHLLTVQTGTKVNSTVVAILNLSVFAITLLGFKTLHDLRTQKGAKVDKQPIQLTYSPRDQANEATYSPRNREELSLKSQVTTFSVSALYGFSAADESTRPWYLNTNGKTYSKSLSVIIPWVVSDLDVDPTHTFLNPSMYLQHTDNQVAWLTTRNRNKSDLEWALLGMKVIYRAKDKEERTFPKLKPYAVYTHTHLHEGFEPLLRHVLGLDKESNIPSDIISLCAVFFAEQPLQRLGPKTQVFTLPPLKDWHWKELETLYWMRGLLEIPGLKKIASNPDQSVRHELFNLLLNSWERTIQRPLHDWMYSEKVGNNLFGVRLIPEEDLGREIVRVLTDTQGNESAFTGDLSVAESGAEDYPWRKGIVFGGEKAHRDYWCREIERMIEIYSDPRISEYLPLSRYDMLCRESTLIPFLLDEVKWLWSVMEGCTYDKYSPERVFSKFSRDTTVVITPHSDHGDEGFLYRRVFRFGGVIDEKLISRELEPYFDRPYVNHPANKNKQYWDQNKGSWRAKLGPGFKDDRLSFDMDASVGHWMIKQGAFSDTRPTDIDGYLRFLKSGKRVFDWLESFESSVFGSQWTDTKSGLLNAGTLDEITSFWSFNTHRYVEMEWVKYMGYNWKRFPQEHYPLMKDYIESMLPVMGIGHNEWNVFCLRHMSLDTARRIIENTEPDIGTFVRTNRDFIQLVDRDYSALKKYDPDKETSALLSHWADHGLCNFVWHRAHMSSVLKTIMTSYTKEEEIIGIDDIRLDFLRDIPSSTNLSKDLELYMKLYAAVTLRDNLVQQMTQINVSSGFSIRRDIDSEFLRTHHTYYLNHTQDPFEHHQLDGYSDLKKERDRLLHEAGDSDPEKTVYVRDMLVTQSTIILQYGISPYTDWSTRYSGPDVSYPVTDDVALMSSGVTSGLLRCDLARQTLSEESENWAIYDLEAPLHPLESME